MKAKSRLSLVALVLLLLGALAYVCIGKSVCFLVHSGLRMPFSAKILRADDSRWASFHGDGEYYVVFQVDSKTIDNWLRNPTPLRKRDWQKGPIPAIIGFYPDFGYESPALEQYSVGTTRLSGGSPELLYLLASSNIWYSAQERGPDFKSWHDGDLLILDPETNRIWFSSWNR